MDWTRLQPLKGMGVVTTDFVGKDANLPGIGSSPQFMEAIFMAREKAPVDSVAFPQGFAVYEVEGVKPPATPTFDEIGRAWKANSRTSAPGCCFPKKHRNSLTVQKHLMI